MNLIKKSTSTTEHPGLFALISQSKTGRVTFFICSLLFVRLSLSVLADAVYHSEFQPECFSLPVNAGYATELKAKEEHTYIVPSERGSRIFVKFLTILRQLNPNYSVPPLFVSVNFEKFGHLNAVTYAGSIYVAQDLIENEEFSEEEIIAILMHEYGHFVHKDSEKVCFTKKSNQQRELMADQFAVAQVELIYGPHQTHVESYLQKLAKFRPSAAKESDTHPSIVNRIAAISAKRVVVH